MHPGKDNIFYAITVTPLAAADVGVPPRRAARDDSGSGGDRATPWPSINVAFNEAIDHNGKGIGDARSAHYEAHTSPNDPVCECIQLGAVVPPRSVHHGRFFAGRPGHPLERPPPLRHRSPSAIEC